MSGEGGEEGGGSQPVDFVKGEANIITDVV